MATIHIGFRGFNSWEPTENLCLAISVLPPRTTETDSCMPTLPPAQAQRRGRSASALSVSGGEDKSEHSEAADQRLSTYSDGGVFSATSSGTSGLPASLLGYRCRCFELKTATTITKIWIISPDEKRLELWRGT